MLRFCLARLLIAIAALGLVSIATFALTSVAIDPATAMAGETASQADIASIRRAYNLDRPLVERYGGWLAKTLTGDFGVSYRMKVPVLEVVMRRIPVTLTLALASLCFALAISVSLGVAAAVRPGSALDRSVLALAAIGQSMPSFWLALMLIVVFGVGLGWLPVSGSGTWKHFVLPTVVLGYFVVPGLLRLTRAGMVEALGSDYVRTARAKGLRSRAVTFRHALRNALGPVVALAAVQLGYMLGGSVVVETVFAMQGLGYLAWEAISSSDIPVVQCIVILMAAVYSLLILAADVVNAALDPRLRQGRPA